MIRKFKFLTLLLSYNLLFCSLSAQSDLREDASFFQSKKAETEYWLTETGIAQVFELKDIIVEKEKLKLKLKSNLNTADSTITAWNLLKREFDKTDNIALARYLFNSLAFEMELGKDSLELFLSSPLEDFKIIISYNKQQGVTMVEDKFLIPTRTFKVIKIKLEELSVTGGASSVSDDRLTIKGIRKKLSTFLSSFYKPKGTFWLDAEFEVLTDKYNELTFEVTKLSKEILNDRNYFEYIRIEIKIVKKDKDFEIKYQIQGKYSGGFGFAPRRSEYRNMQPDFSDYIRRYEQKMAQKINKLLID